MRRAKSSSPDIRKDSIQEEVGFLRPSPLDDLDNVRQEALLRVLEPPTTPPPKDEDLFMSAKMYCLLVDSKETNV